MNKTIITLSFVSALSLPSIASATPDYPLFADINGDCVVDETDLTPIEQKAQGMRIYTPYNTDIDGDGDTDMNDYNLAYSQYWTPCGQRLLGDVDGSGLVTAKDVRAVTAAVGTINKRLDLDKDWHVTQKDVDIVVAQLGDTMGRRVVGDVNGDYAVTEADITEALSLQGETTNAADINRDGAVDDHDLDAIEAMMGTNACSQLNGDVNSNRFIHLTDLLAVQSASGSKLTQFDCNLDGVVDADDLTLSSDNFDTVAANHLYGDINGDWVVDQRDVDLVDAAIKTGWEIADLTGDGAVTAADLLEVLSVVGDNTMVSFNGDINNDCVVDSTDVALLQAFSGSSFAPADSNADGVINTTDVLAILPYVGSTCE